MSLIQSSSPRIAQHLRGTALTGVSDKQLSQWGGAVHSRAQVEGALASLDGVIVLLELAGYVVDSVAFAVAKGNTTHKNADAVVLELPSLTLSRGVEGAWASQPEGAPRGRVGLWVRPRRARLPNDLWLDGCAVDLRQRLTLFADLGIRMEFSPAINGWFTLPVDSARWADSLARACRRACDKIVDILADCVSALVPEQSLVRSGCGLLALLDPEGWQLGDPTIVGTVTPLDAASGASDFGGAVFAQFTADPARFLLEDTATAPLTALERIDMLVDLRTSESRWAEMLDDLGGVDGSPTGVGELRPEYGDVLSWTHLIFWMHELGVLDGLSAIAAAQPVLTEPAVPYGGYVLRRGDSDAASRWGGRIASAEDRSPELGNFGYVRQLQSDLRQVGILLGPTPDGEFDVMTEMALREFEIAARFPRVARLRTDAVGELPEDTLEGIPLPEEYRLVGPILGSLEPPVAKALRVWVTKGWRHPVVLYAVLGGEVKLVNIWRWDAIKREGTRVVAWDESGQYHSGTAHDLPYFVGRYTARMHGGPTVTAYEVKYLWGEAILTPSRLIDSQIEETPEASHKTNPTWSTYRVLAAVAEVEMLGRYDVLNAYDSDVISLGVCHWTLKGGENAGELGALFALLRARDPDGFEAVLGRFGVRPTGIWPNDGMTYDGALYQYTSTLSMRRADGAWAPVITTSRKNDEKQWFRGWCWFYRLQLACRTSEPLQRVMWEMGRIRLRDLWFAPWPNRDMKVSQIATTELLMAMLLRWHVKRPSDLFYHKRLDTVVLPTGDPSTWGEAEYAAIESSIFEALPSGDTDLRNSMSRVRENSRLERGHNSFRPDWSGL